MNLNQIGQIALNAEDLDRAVAFYRDVLGLAFLFSTGSLACFQCGEVRLMLSLPEQAGDERHSSILYYHVPDIQAVCSGDIAYNNIHMWLWNSTPDSREAWLSSLDAVAALEPSTIVTGHKDPEAPDDDATRVLDQSRRYIEDFDQAVATSSNPQEVIDLMLPKYSGYGNRYTLFTAAVSQFPS